jgi:GWxTD domain-containing protein
MPKISRALIILVVFLVGCATEQIGTIQSGGGYQYRRGFPEVTMSAIGIFDDRGQPGINVAVDIVFGSLIYKNVDDIFTSDVNIEVQIIKLDASAPTAINRSFDFSITDKNNSITSNQDVFSFQERFPTPPGRYTINVTVTDKQSNKNTMRTSSTQIPDPESTKILLTDINMLARVDSLSGGNNYFPLTTYDVPARFDTLKFQYQITKGDPNSRLDVTMRLYKFRIDSLPARAMYLRDYSPSEIGYKGIDTRNAEVIETQTRTLLDESGSILIEYPIANLPRGAYRFEITVVGGDIEAPLISSRDFSVKTDFYPSVRTVRELAEPLVYLMDDRKHRRMMEIQDLDSLKYEIDYFWLNNLENAIKARSVLEMYYLRIEEANKQFPHFKPGWMTDPGMIYVLFGPPWDVEVRLDQMRWVYGNNPDDPSRVFFFKRTRIAAREYPFEIYVLQRSPYYFEVLNSKVQDWLSGLILTRQL